jgi:hypothetical protein
MSRTLCLAFASLATACLSLLASCVNDVATVDAGRDGGTDAGPIDPATLYQECTLTTGCPGVGEVCFPIRGSGRDSAACAYRCRNDTDCAGGLCLVTTGTIDDGPRCRQTCAVDTDCNAAAFGCQRATIMGPRGTFEADLCYPE